MTYWVGSCCTYAIQKIRTIRRPSLHVHESKSLESRPVHHVHCTKPILRRRLFRMLFINLFFILFFLISFTHFYVTTPLIELLRRPIMHITGCLGCQHVKNVNWIVDQSCNLTETNVAPFCGLHCSHVVCPCTERSCSYDDVSCSHRCQWTALIKETISAVRS